MAEVIFTGPTPKGGGIDYAELGQGLGTGLTSIAQIIRENRLRDQLKSLTEILTGQKPGAPPPEVPAETPSGVPMGGAANAGTALAGTDGAMAQGLPKTKEDLARRLLQFVGSDPKAFELLGTQNAQQLVAMMQGTIPEPQTELGKLEADKRGGFIGEDVVAAQTKKAIRGTPKKIDWEGEDAKVHSALLYDDGTREMLGTSPNAKLYETTTQRSRDGRWVASVIRKDTGETVAQTDLGAAPGNYSTSVQTVGGKDMLIVTNNDTGGQVVKQTAINPSSYRTDTFTNDKGERVVTTFDKDGTPVSQHNLGKEQVSAAEKKIMFAQRAAGQNTGNEAIDAMTPVQAKAVMDEMGVGEGGQFPLSRTIGQNIIEANANAEIFTKQVGDLRKALAKVGDERSVIGSAGAISSFVNNAANTVMGVLNISKEALTTEADAAIEQAASGVIDKLGATGEQAAEIRSMMRGLAYAHAAASYGQSGRSLSDTDVRNAAADLNGSGDPQVLRRNLDRIERNALQRVESLVNSTNNLNDTYQFKVNEGLKKRLDELNAQEDQGIGTTPKPGEQPAFSLDQLRSMDSAEREDMDLPELEHSGELIAKALADPNLTDRKERDDLIALGKQILTLGKAKRNAGK